MKKIIFICLVLNISMTFSLLAQDDEKMCEKFFPEPSYDMPVPIVHGNKQKNFYTSYKDAVHFLKELTAKHADLMSLSTFGQSQRGKDLIAVTFNKKSNTACDKKIRIIFLASIHGNEPISADGMLYLIYQLTEDPTYNGLLDNILLEVIPIVNVDGHSDETRATNNVTDLNRDLAALTTPESKNLKTEINRFNPHMVVDFHEYSPRRKDFLELNDCLTPAYDALFLYTGNLNVNPDIRNMISADIVAPAKIFLEQNQRRVNDYCTTLRNGKEVILNMGGTASRSSATNYALQNRISLLTEIRGGSEKEKATKRRIETSFLAAVSYLTTAHNNAERIIKVVDEANHETFNSTRLMVVTSTPEMKIIPYTFIDVCNLEYKVIDFNTRNGLVQTPQITRSRPAAYIISPCTEKIKTVLTVSGVNFSEIKDSKQLSDVEAYQRQSNGKLELKNLNIEWGAGGILIDMHQAMGNVIADLIEPEGNNSMYSNEIFKKLLHEDILPVYRLSKEQLLQINN